MNIGPYVQTEGLVFGYDTGRQPFSNFDHRVDKRRYFKGEPTVNEFNPNAMYNGGYGGIGEIRSGELDAFGTTANTVYRKTGKIRFGVTNGVDVGTLYYGNTYTFSIYMRHVPGYIRTTSSEFDICDRGSSRNYSGTLGSNMTYEWKRFTVTALHNNSSNYHFIDIGVYQGTNVFEWCCPQIELKNYATPFVPYGTRSSTQSLLDLARTTDINVSNVSFDSTGVMTFDGTDDNISLSTSLINNLDTAELTTEAVVYHTAWGTTGSSRPYIANWNTWNPTTPNQRGFILRTYGTSQNPSFWYCWGASYNSITSNISMNLNQYYHVVGVFKKNAYAKIYVNGVEAGTSTVGTGNNLVYDTSTGTRIGFGTINTGRFVGQLPVTKIYNRALTSREVKQNYGTYKTRFDL